jgi:hypothetical protein
MSIHDSGDFAGLPCEGWWEQDMFGRQPMRELTLRFGAGRITGSGHDIIGSFTISGAIAADGKVVLFKRYVAMHAVRYVGNYDGEGLMWGQWWIGPLHNRWLIKVNTSRTAALAAAEIEAIM